MLRSKFQVSRVVGGRHALPFFLLSIAASLLIAPGVAFAQPGDRPGVTVQRYDDDCGVAALLMLLQRAGVNVTEKELLAGLKPGSSVEALTSADLADLVAALGVNLQLDIGFVPVSVAANLAQREPYLVLIKPRVFGASRAIDHFILIEGRVGNTYLTADPVLPSRVRLSDAVFARDVHGKVIDGKPYALVLKLSRDSKRVASQVPLKPSDERLRYWDQAYRLPLSLPAGKVVMSIGQHRQETGVIDQTAGTEANETSNVTVFSAAVGVGHRTELGLTLARITGSGLVRLPGETISFERSGDFSATLGVKHIPSIVLPQSVGLTTGAAIEWSNDIAPSAGSVSANISWVKGGFELGLGTMLRHDGKVAALITPSISYQLPVKRAFIIDAGIAAPYRIGDPRPFYEMQVSVSRNLGPNVLVSAYFSNGILMENGLHSRRFGLTLGYGIPRRFRTE